LISDIESYPLSQPVVVMGDFNSVETNYWRQVLHNEFMFTGALTHIGRGFINTFPSKHRIYGGVIPFISIDEIYHRGINGMSGEVLSDYLGSDHYPVMLKVKL
jgi:endonuclease/exonuclease/phosphatase (EEP) superfamily protein YafD